MTTSYSKHVIPNGTNVSSRVRWLAQQERSLPRSAKYLLHSPKHGFLVSGTVLVDRDYEMWTDSLDDAQVYYDSANAYHKARILASITALDIEVISFDG